MSRPSPSRSSPARLAAELGDDANEGAADLLGDVAVDLVAVDAADVVGLEDGGVDRHAAAHDTRPAATVSFVESTRMSGHSKWASIKHKKAIVDSRKGKLFTKLARGIVVAAREGGGDIEGNPSLALAVQKAKDASMPKDNIERAIAKGTGADKDADAFESVLYEGYGPGGVAILVEALTDNRNRTGADIRHAFSKAGGNLGEPGSVAYLFEKKGLIVVDGGRYAEDDAAAGDRGRRRGHRRRRRRDRDHHRSIRADRRPRGARGRRASRSTPSEVQQRPQTSVPVDAETATKLMRLIDVLDDNDDVDSVHANFDAPSEVLEAAAAAS